MRPILDFQFLILFDYCKKSQNNPLIHSKKNNSELIRKINCKMLFLA